MLVGIQITQRAMGQPMEFTLLTILKLEDDVDTAGSSTSLWEPVLNNSEWERPLD